MAFPQFPMAFRDATLSPGALCAARAVALGVGALLRSGGRVGLAAMEWIQATTYEDMGRLSLFIIDIYIYINIFIYPLVI